MLSPFYYFHFFITPKKQKKIKMKKMAGVIIFKKNVFVVDKEYEREHVLFGFSSIPHAIHIDFKI